MSESAGRTSVGGHLVIGRRSYLGLSQKDKLTRMCVPQPCHARGSADRECAHSFEQSVIDEQTGACE